MCHYTMHTFSDFSAVEQRILKKIHDHHKVTPWSSDVNKTRLACSAILEKHRLLWNVKVHHGVRERPPRIIP
jgi:hypothetical protein